MSIKEVYESIGANYQDAMARLPGEAFVTRFALKFLTDKSFPELKEALEAGDAENAFRAAHTLKGVCQNLGFSNLYAPTFELTETLRAGHLEGTDKQFELVAKQYKVTISAIEKMD